MMQRPGHGQLALLSTAAAVTVGRQVVGKVKETRLYGFLLGLEFVICCHWLQFLIRLLFDFVTRN